MSFWRTFSPPPQDYPLALCDGNSVGDEEGVPNTMFVVDKIPEREEMLRPMPDEDEAIAGDLPLQSGASLVVLLGYDS